MCSGGAPDYYEGGGEEGGERVDVSLVTGKVRQIGVDLSESGTSLRCNNTGALIQQDGRIVVHQSAGRQGLGLFLSCLFISFKYSLFVFCICGYLSVILSIPFS